MRFFLRIIFNLDTYKVNTIATKPFAFLIDEKLNNDFIAFITMQHDSKYLTICSIVEPDKFFYEYTILDLLINTNLGLLKSKNDMAILNDGNIIFYAYNNNGIGKFHLWDPYNREVKEFIFQEVKGAIVILLDIKPTHGVYAFKEFDAIMLVSEREFTDNKNNMRIYICNYLGELIQQIDFAVDNFEHIVPNWNLVIKILGNYITINYPGGEKILKFKKQMKPITRSKDFADIDIKFV